MCLSYGTEGQKGSDDKRLNRAMDLFMLYFVVNWYYYLGTAIMLFSHTEK